MTWMSLKVRRALCASPLLAGLALHGGTAHAADETDAADEVQIIPMLSESSSMGLFEELKSGFYSRINLLAYGLTQMPKESTINVDNSAEIPRYQAVFNPRADFLLNFRRLELGIKPRAMLTWEKWKDGTRSGDTNYSSDVYINEGWIRYRPVDELVVSFGRENLQWGPSVTISTSNPFTRDNGRNNPRVEVPGRDYARAIWIPSPNWSVSAIANIGEGRANNVQSYTAGNMMYSSGLEEEQFEKTYALKLDYTGSSTYFSVIPSYRKHTAYGKNDDYRVGFFGGWNATDAMLLYGEGSWRDKGKTDFQVGASYTLEIGPTINLEYLRNNNGCKNDPLYECFLTQQVASSDALYRKNYAMLQYTDTTSIRNLEIELRFLRNLDDDSNRLIGIFQYDVSNHIQLYVIGNGFTGGKNDEFGTLMKYSVFAGVGYTF